MRTPLRDGQYGARVVSQRLGSDSPGAVGVQGDVVIPREEYDSLVTLAGTAAPTVPPLAIGSDVVLGRTAFDALVAAALSQGTPEPPAQLSFADQARLLTQDYTSADGLLTVSSGQVVLDQAVFQDLVAMSRRRGSSSVGFPEIFLDLDGCMADFDAHFPVVFGLSHIGLPDDEMWALINTHPSYFLDMPLMPGAREFFDSIRHLDPTILTACPNSNYAAAAAQKRAWVQRELGADVRVLPVLGGKNKVLFMHAPGDILIDDWRKNCDAWTAGGGTAIVHRSFAETSDLLRGILADRRPVETTLDQD